MKANKERNRSVSFTNFSTVSKLFFEKNKLFKPKEKIEKKKIELLGKKREFISKITESKTVNYIETIPATAKLFSNKPYDSIKETYEEKSKMNQDKLREMLKKSALKNTTGTENDLKLVQKMSSDDFKSSLNKKKRFQKALLELECVDLEFKQIEEEKRIEEQIKHNELKKQEQKRIEEEAKIAKKKQLEQEMKEAELKAKQEQEMFKKQREDERRKAEEKRVEEEQRRKEQEEIAKNEQRMRLDSIEEKRSLEENKRFEIGNIFDSKLSPIKANSELKEDTLNKNMPKGIGLTAGGIFHNLQKNGNIIGIGGAKSATVESSGTDNRSFTKPNASLVGEKQDDRVGNETNLKPFPNGITNSKSQFTSGIPNVNGIGRIPSQNNRNPILGICMSTQNEDQPVGKNDLKVSQNKNLQHQNSSNSDIRDNRKNVQSTSGNVFSNAITKNHNRFFANSDRPTPIFNSAGNGQPSQFVNTFDRKKSYQSNNSNNSFNKNIGMQGNFVNKKDTKIDIFASNESKTSKNKNDSYGNNQSFKRNNQHSMEVNQDVRQNPFTTNWNSQPPRQFGQTGNINNLSQNRSNVFNSTGGGIYGNQR